MDSISSPSGEGLGITTLRRTPRVLTLWIQWRGIPLVCLPAGGWRSGSARITRVSFFFRVVVLS
ncbi:hypothetical protein LINPERHAP1_LOCUS25059 [Linum perenne]